MGYIAHRKIITSNNQALTKLLLYTYYYCGLNCHYNSIDHYLPVILSLIFLGRLSQSVVKMHYFYKKYSSLLPGIDQINQVCSNDDQERVYQNCKFHDPLGRGSCARGCDHISHIVKMHYFF